MKDTSPEIQEIYHTMLMARTGLERLCMGCDLFSTSRELVISVLNRKDTEEIRAQLFLRFYGSEFTAAERARILSSIRAYDVKR